jgi:hypothetical protein
MDSPPRIAALAALISLSACGSGGVAGTDPLRNPSVSWTATLRNVPTDIHVSMQTPTIPFMYVDSGAANGVYPSPSAFRSAIESANPGLLSGACATIARMSAGVMQFTDAQGIQAPSYIVFFQPIAVGTCTQRINVGAEGVQSFSLTVTP